LPASHSPPSSRRSGVVLSSAQTAGYQAFGYSHRGLVRPGNEDSYLVAPTAGLFIVADGMGGAAAGEVASRMAIEEVHAAFEVAEGTDVTWPGAMQALPSPAQGGPRLVAAVERANVRVHAFAAADQSKAGMGTTMTAMLVHEGRVQIAHVGDSRLYRLRRGKLELLTEDHSLVNEYVRAGEMSAEEAERSPYKHIISRAVGTDARVKVDRRVLDVLPGDTLLLCTDGLHGVVGDDDIAATLLAEPDIARAVMKLIEASLDGGAPDNVTAVVVRFSGNARLGEIGSGPEGAEARGQGRG
jgi:protein phosphatase